MSPQRYQQVKTIVADALEREPAERTAFVRAACGTDEELQCEVESILAQSGDQIEGFAEDLNATLATKDEISRVGEVLGAYEIVREIGRGGMGAVYLARRSDRTFEKQVAIKLLKRGTDTDEVLRRFRAERQILARLEHPNIARLIDAGTSADGLPYFVMEYVEGTPITDFCRERALNVRQRIELFLEVCSAVQFAHQNLVVHRDLKPGNILVTDDSESVRERGGHPKLLDFGIAKLLSPDSEFAVTTIQDGQRLTPGYASPEQVRGDSVTTASDVYSLGALLYELLVGTSPHRFKSTHPSPTELFSVIVEQQPQRASLAASQNRQSKIANRKSLEGDLDNILMTALRKEPERRYPGVTSLTDDIRRYFAGRPVRARPSTLGYRTSKFISRNRLAVAAGILLFLTLVGGVVATTWQARIAQRRFADVRKLAHSVIFDYHDPIASLPGSTAVRERLVKDALEYLDNLAGEGTGDAILLRELASAYQRVGRIQGNSYYSNLGDPTGAMKSYRESLTLREKLFAVRPDDPEIQHELADSHQGIGDVHYTLGDLRAALASYESALKLREPLAATNLGEIRFALALAQLYARFGDLYGLEGFANLGDTSAALAYCRKAHEILAPLAAAHPDDQKLQTEFGNGVVISALFALSAGRAGEALGTAQRGLEILRKMAKPDDQDSITSLMKAKVVLRWALADNNRIEEAIALSREMIADLEKMIVADPRNNMFRRNLGVVHNALGKDLLKAGKIAEAQEHHRAAVRIVEEAFAAESTSEDTKSDVAFTWQGHGQAQMANGEYQAAVEILRRALALREPSLVADPSNARVKEDVSSIYADLGTSLASLGDFAAAKEAARKAIPAAEQLSTQDPTHARRKARLAEALFNAGTVFRKAAQAEANAAEDLRQAQEYLARALALWQELRDRNALAPANSSKPDEVARELALCDDVLKR